MKDNDYGKKILSTVLIVLLVTAAITAAVDRNIFVDIYTLVSKPFLQVTSTIADDPAGGRTREELASENEELHNEINDLVSRLIDYDDIKKENEMLRKYYGIREEHTDYEIAVASVIRRDPNDDFYGFTIDKGSRDDVKINNPVMTDSGLVGFISEVSVTTSRVTTLLSPEAKVGAIDQKTHDSGIITGSTSLFEDGYIMLSVISADNKIAAGDIVITTGVGGVYPAGLVVGKVTSLGTSEYDASPYAVIKPYADLRIVSDVVVITGFEGQGVISAADELSTDTSSGKSTDSDKQNNSSANTTVSAISSSR